MAKAVLFVVATALASFGEAFVSPVARSSWTQGTSLRHSSRAYDNRAHTIMSDADSKPSWKAIAAASLAAAQVLWTGLPAIDTSAFAAHATEQVSTAIERGPFEDAWDYTNKFYLDRSHNGNDWSQVRERYRAEINSGKMNQRQATKEMLNLLGDKYTRLISAQVYESLSKYDMLGAGVMLSPNSEGRLSVAAPPMAASAAEKRGIVKGDLVTAINGMPTATMTSFDVIEFLSKYQEPTITFTITKPDGGSERVVELQRSFQKVSDPVEYSLEAKDGHKVGYMRIKEFNAVVVDKVREALVDLQAQGADEYILDLRGNGGGAFQSALGIASLFMENAPITYVVDGDGKKVGFNTKTDAVNTSAPLVVWIDRKSASASEVLAGALHDDCRALLMGTRSFGKGLIQAVYGLSDGSGLIVTVARYETPRGTNIQGTGIQPDLKVSLPKIGKAIDQGSFDIARERQLTCPPFE